MVVALEGHEFDAAYWGRNLRQTVRFTDAVSGLLEDGVTIFVELGPHPILLHSIAQTAQCRDKNIIALACGRRQDHDLVALSAALGQLWAGGYPIDWTRVLSEGGRVATLPHYPWQREKHWIDAADIGSFATNAHGVRKGLSDESRDLLFDLHWKPSDPPDTQAMIAAESRWLVVSADAEAGSAVAAALRSVGVVVTIECFETLEVAIKEFARSASPVREIVVLASDDRDAGYLPIRAMKSVLNTEVSPSPRLWLVTRGAQAVGRPEGARVAVDQAALWGAGRVVGEEHPELWGGLIDLDPTADSAAGVKQLVRCLMANDGEDQVALRDDRRYVLRLARTSPNLGAGPVTWRRDATYLITGGLGDIGLHLARRLAANGVRRLVLMSRTPLPPRRNWSAVELQTAVGRRIAAVRALEADGVAVHLAAVDVSDEAQLRAFIDRYAAEGWPPIRGVIHAAGTADNQLATSLNRKSFDAVLSSKLRGAQFLDRLLPDLDLFVMMSSMAAFTAQTGQANYAAANAGLDALAHDRRARGLPAVSIGWGVWDDTGLMKGEAGRGIMTELARQGVRPFLRSSVQTCSSGFAAAPNPMSACLQSTGRSFARPEPVGTTLFIGMCSLGLLLSLNLNWPNGLQRWDLRSAANWLIASLEGPSRRF